MWVATCDLRGRCGTLERWERSLPIVGGAGDVARLIGQAEALGVRLDARPGGRLWANRPDRLSPDLRDNLAAHRTAVVALLTILPMHPAHAWRCPTMPNAPPLALARHGVPPEWCDGVALLATMPAPIAIPSRRWAVLAATSARLLRDHGATLHGATWDALDLFGLHQYAPATNPPGWGLAWLLGEIGEVLDVSPDAAGVRCGPNGVRLAFRHRCAAARAGVVPAWMLPPCARLDCRMVDLPERKEASRYG